MNWIKENFSPMQSKPKGWVSVRDIMNETGNNRKTIAERLRNMVAIGELECQKFLEDGKVCNCYKKIK